MVLESLTQSARARCARIVLSEGDDSRIREAAASAAKAGLAELSIVGNSTDPVHGVDVIDPKNSSRLVDYAEALFNLRKHKGMTEEVAETMAATPLGYSALMVRMGDADGTIGGAVHTTSDVVRTALQIIGKAGDVDVVSSFFLMILADGRPVIFSDCGLILQPTTKELASIALASSNSFRALTGGTPRIAMLSFSTHGSVPSSSHESLDRIKNAVQLVNELAPGTLIDGELQFDAAFVPEVAAKKAPDSPIAGDANIFVFPSLSAGNIGYKIAQRLGGATALGPILQGLSKPANDLSRGCSADDVFKMIAITGAQIATQPA